MNTPLYSPEQRAAIETALLTLLRQRGPSLTAELAAPLGLNYRQAAWFLARLRLKGQVSSRKLCGGGLTDQVRGYQTLTQWTWINDPPLGALKDRKSGQNKVQAGIGITAEDCAWMAYWSQRREQRRQQKERRHAL